MAAGELRATPSRVSKKRARQQAKKPSSVAIKCMNGDGHLAHARGLCPGCYQSARAKIAAKETTWEELERLKLAKPRYAKPGRSAFNDRFAKLKRAGNGGKR